MSHHLQSQSPVQTGARQTMLAWSRVIESREDIPTFYKICFDQYFDKGQPFPHVVLTPALTKFPRSTTEKLVCDTDEALSIFEKDRNQVNPTRYTFRDICSVEVGIVLLRAWLTFHGTTSQGEARVSTIDINTTSLRHFDAVLRRLRPVSAGVDKAQFAAEKDKLDCLEQSSFKFMNYGRSSLVPGETVLRFLLQGDIRQPFWTVLGRTFYKTLSLTHLTILTDRELILIRNMEGARESHVDRYGGVWQYIPLHRLDSVTISKDGSEHSVLSIRHQPGETIERLFESSRQRELEQFYSQLQLLTEHSHTTG